MHEVVEYELELTLVLSPDRGVPVPARLVYRANDPFAVQIVFHVGSNAPVRWTFARELMIEGVFRPCGEGDVRIWPVRVGARAVVCMALRSPDGEALLEAPLAAVSGWLERTLHVVPPGREGELLDTEKEFAGLCTAVPADESPAPGAVEGRDRRDGGDGRGENGRTEAMPYGSTNFSETHVNHEQNSHHSRHATGDEPGRRGEADRGRRTRPSGN